MSEIQKQPASSQFPCKSCGGSLVFAPGTAQLKCPHCGAENTIETKDTEGNYLKEHDFLQELENEHQRQQDTVDVPEAEAARCSNCGAVTTVTKERTADCCPYCGSPLVIQNAFSCKFNVQALLAFSVSSNTAHETYKKWIVSRWFAPNDFSRRATREEALRGIYMPFWTYDSETRTYYTGERGDAYYVTRTRTVERNGKSVQEEYRERRVDWSYASGTVYVDFDDILVPASHSLPPGLQDSLAPWPLDKLAPFRQEYLSGFVTETYQVPLREGFEDAQKRMSPVIDNRIRQDIGGDEQRIHSKSTSYSGITFKHILLPVWMSAYRYNNKTYRFMINAQTGEAVGNRPWSVWKVAGAVIATIGIVSGIVYALNGAGVL